MWNNLELSYIAGWEDKNGTSSLKNDLATPFNIKYVSITKKSPLVCV